MANVLKHRFVSPKTDGADPTQIQPSSWNDGHAFSGGTQGTILTRDTSDAQYGAQWIGAVTASATFGAQIEINSTTPGMSLVETDAAADQRVWRWIVEAGTARMDMVNDARNTVQATALAWNRSGDLYVGRNIYERGLGTPIGHWQDVPFNAANFFSTGGMTWTVTSGQVLTNRYALVGKTLHWSVFVFASTLAGTASPEVRINLPAGFTSGNLRNTMPTAYLYDSVYQQGWVQTIGSTYVTIGRQNGTNHTLISGQFHVAFTIAIEIT